MLRTVYFGWICRQKYFAPKMPFYSQCTIAILHIDLTRNCSLRLFYILAKALKLVSGPKNCLPEEIQYFKTFIVLLARIASSQTVICNSRAKAIQNRLNWLKHWFGLKLLFHEWKTRQFQKQTNVYCQSNYSYIVLAIQKMTFSWFSYLISNVNLITKQLMAYKY